MTFKACLLAAATATALLSQPLQAQTALRFANTLSANDTHNQAARHMAEQLKKQSGDKVTMSVHPAGELGNDGAILEGVRLGSIDLAIRSSPSLRRA